jgi:hypothetical protein
MLEHITQEFEQGRYVCYDTILDRLYCEHHLTVLSDTLRHLIHRTDAFKTISGIPIESKHCSLTVEVIEDQFNRLAQNNANVPASFIFDIDESGFHEFMDVHEVQVVVLASFPHDSVTIPVNRTEKRSAVLAAISAEGSYLTQVVIVQWKMYEIDLCESGLTPEAVMIVHRERGFIDRNLFDLWASRVLFPEIERRHGRFHSMGDVIVRIDGCACHGSDCFLDEASAQNVILYWLPPHSSDKVQPLDLGSFGLTKQALRKVRIDPDKAAQSTHLIRMLCAWHIAAIPKNVMGSFRRTGLFMERNEEQERPMAKIVIEAADRAQEVFFHEAREDETKDELLSNDDRDELLAKSE